MMVMAGAAERGDLVQAFETARAAGDVEAMAQAALRIAADRRFGAPLAAPGYLHEAYERSAGLPRVRLAVELARAWGYANEPDRAVPFAREAVVGAEEFGDLPLLAAALDAHLVSHWGPDDLTARLTTTARLEAVAGRLTDVETRLSAALWRLTTALESLDVVAVRRQLRVLEDLAHESGAARVEMFAASRQGMYALVVGDLELAGRLLGDVRRAGAGAGEPDTKALAHVLTSGVAMQTGDTSALAGEAAAYEVFALKHGIRSILAEASLLWLRAGSTERAAALLEQVIAGGLSRVPKDVDWLLTVTTATEIAARTGALDIARDAVDLLPPYAGRGVVNAGGVAFVGVVDDYLRMACTALGREEDASRWARQAFAGYRRLGARWWVQRLQAEGPHDRRMDRSATEASADVERPATRLVLAPSGDDIWLIGPDGRSFPTRAVKGFRYLRLLLARPRVEVTALDLAAAVAGHGSTSQPDLGEVLDRRALAAYRRRVAELDAELSEARDWADDGRTAQLSAERGFLLDEIAAATGLHGRPRVTGATAERARVAVQKSVVAAIRRIEELDPSTGRLLRDTIRTGTACSYQPDPGRAVTWVLDLPPGPLGRGRE